ncbi:DUF5696 domain-containing protein [Paenibacillus sp. p3-SID867]|uniref:DUF5696 domain-containing protein n=1 Tax=Paenibacillus sp. p3-SID867 TaxID=2916363 RepID=UPI0021A74CBB|nr:DUF5696 domain-containing protein [Paenibacillus sp. p3-SID867]MCT1401154.1 DUF5696 domain-containing protein [Paenibacillus sp. p3-SID867]
MGNFAKYMLLAASVLTALIMAGCTDKGPEKAAGDEGNGPANSFTPGAALKSSFVNPSVKGMKGIAENDQLQLLADDQTGGIAVVHKASGEIWHSNTPGHQSDPLAAGVNKSLLSSQLKLDFYNSFGQINSVNSHADSAAYKQLGMEEIPNGVRVNYRFGTDKKTIDDMPKKISKSRFEQNLLSKLDSAGQRTLKIAYTEDAEQGVYVRSDGALKGLQLERALKAFEDAGYTEDDLLVDIEENHLDQTKPEPRVFHASIEYTLDGDSLIAKLPVSSIDFPAEYPVNTISFLSFFGAGGAEDKGSILVPDGSGALIHFNNGKTRYPSYQQSVYGMDRTMSGIETADSSQDVRLPVFGIIREGGAFIGIIEEGAPAATINADVSGRLNSYNYVYPTFTVINKGDLSLDANGQQRSLPKFQENPMRSDFSVRYAFVGKQSASYPGLAAYYRNYLEQQGGLPAIAERNEENMPFYLQLVGSIYKKKHFAGIPYRALEPLTTFEQAQSILTEMGKRGIHDIKLKYSGWFNKGLDHEVPGSVSVDQQVGGEKGLRRLLSYANENGVKLYPDVSILTALSGSGFNEAKEASRTLRGIPAEIYSFNPALNRRDRTDSPAYVISPRFIGSYTEALLKDYGKYGAIGVSLSDLAAELDSDFRKHRQIDRTESEQLSLDALNKVSDANLQVMADGGNAYALPFLTDITHAPMSSSRFKIEDAEIPFYQMVIRGHIDYTGAPYNLSAYTDAKPYILKCLEYGAGVYFQWFYEPNHKIKDTEHNELFSANYALWIDEAARIYEEVNAFLKKVRHERIFGHDELADGVFKTTYESGVYVIVNYNRAPVTIDGVTIEAESYVTGGEAP